jgi:hypothetical protein
MAGRKGRSGRRPKPLRLHVLHGTYRADRHGPLPSVAAALATSPAPEEADALPPEATEEWLAGLGVRGRQFVLRLLANYGPWPELQLEALRQLGQVLDDLGMYRDRIGREGVMLTRPRGAPYLNPLVRAEREARKEFRQGCARLLGLAGASG